MRYVDYVAQLRTDSAALGEILTAADPTLRVRSCADWSLADLGHHVAEGYQHKTAAIRTSLRPDPWPPEPLPELWRLPVAEFLATSAADLLSALAGRDPAQPCWTWLPEQQTVGFWARRMAQETVVHLWDASDAIGRPAPIGDRVAADGIDELLVAFLAGDWSDDPQPGPSGTVDIDTGPDRWRVGLDADEVTVRHQTLDEVPDVAADAVIAGGAPDLLLALWGRRPLPPVDGPAQALVDALRSRLDIVTR